MFVASGLALASLLPVSARAQTAPIGIDVSHWQHQIDWSAVAGQGYSFAYENATEGTTITDVTYPINRTGANAVGIRIGAYHFARPSGTTDAAITASATAQADAFIAYAQPRPGDLPPALDLEATGGLSAKQLTEWTQAWLDEVTARLGVKPIVYASPAFWKNALGDTPVFATAGNSLWIAHWTKATLPILPGGDWGGLGWTFWQWTDCASVAGIAHCVDGDRFNGANLAGKTIPPFPSGPAAISVPPSIVGTPQSAQLLAALPGSWGGGKPATFAYQWQRCSAAGGGCAPIENAIGETYKPTAADVGHRIAVAVTGSSTNGSGIATSSATLAIAGSTAPAAAAPTPTSPPTIAGTDVAGQTLSAQAGKWKGSPTSFAYQWRRCDAGGTTCVPIAGASTSAYTLSAGDIGSALSLVVTATGRGGTRAATSSTTPVVAAAPLPTPATSSALAQPEQAGAVITAAQNATVTWQPGAIPTQATVSLGASPSRIAMAGSALALGITGAAAPLPWPVDVQYASATTDAVPALIPTAGVWQPAAQLSSASLPSGQEFGYYRDAASILHVLTRIPARIALFAPGKWADPRFVSTRKPQLTTVNEFAATASADGSTTLVRGRVTLDTQAHLYVSVLTPHGQALIPQQGSRVGWWLSGPPAKTLQTLQLRPGAFPIRLRIPTHELVAVGDYKLRLAAVDPYGRRAQLLIVLRQPPRH